MRFVRLGLGMIGASAIAGIAVSLGAFGATDSAWNAPAKGGTLPWPGVGAIIWTVPKIPEQVAKSLRRSPADNNSLNDGDLSAGMTKLRNSFLDDVSLKAGQDPETLPDKLETFLTNLDSTYDSITDDDAKFVAAQMIPLRTFRSFVYRSTKMFSKVRAVRSFAVTGIYGMAKDMKIFLPTDQWEAGFRYVTEPISSADTEFADETAVQKYFREDVANALIKEWKRISALDFKDPPSSGKGRVIDKKFVLGINGESPTLDRYKRITEADRRLVLSAIHARLGQIAYMQLWQLNGMLQSQQTMAELQGLDAAFPLEKVEGVTSFDRVQALKSFRSPKHKFLGLPHAKYPGLYKLASPANEIPAAWAGEVSKFADLEKGKPDLNWGYYAYVHMVKAAVNADLVWDILKDLPANEALSLNPGFITPMNRKIGLAFDDMMNILQIAFEKKDANDKQGADYKADSGDGDLKLAFTGGTSESQKPVLSPLEGGKGVVINLPYYLAHPPADLFDLLPTNWTARTKKPIQRKLATGELVEHRDYFEGRPTDWNATVYKSLFPNIQSGAEVADDMRILDQSWGGWPLAFSLAPFIH